MSRVVFAVDVGNSQTVIGIFRGEEVVEHWRLTTRIATTSDEVLLRIAGLLNHSSVRPSEITHIGLSTVVPMLERPWIKALNFKFRLPVQVVSDENCLNLRIDYALPAQLGPDRICNVLTMRSMGLKNAIAVDMGTATTFDVIRNSGFAGGLIVPGINVSMDVLTNKTARLLPVSLDWTPNLLARTTEDALRAGLLYGFLGQLEFLLQGLRRELKLDQTELPVYATGGWSNLLMEKTKVFTAYDPYLTLRGIRLVALEGNGGKS